MTKCVQRPGSLEHSLLYIREAVLCGYGTTLCWYLACKDLLMLVCSLNCHSGHNKQKILSLMDTPNKKLLLSLLHAWC